MNFIADLPKSINLLKQAGRKAPGASQSDQVMAPASTCTLEIQANLPTEAYEQLARILTESSRTLKFEMHGFERESNRLDIK
jgi:hypothetical protein